MSSEATRDQLATVYLGQLEALAVEIDTAIDAIAGNAVGRLQESVSKQEMLCISLAKMVNIFGAGSFSGEPRSSSESMASSVAGSSDAGASGWSSRNEAGAAKLVDGKLANDKFLSDKAHTDKEPSADLLAKIELAKGALLNLNLRYAALLKHSGDSIALLASLCRSHTGQFQEARGPRSKYQTWSCEM